MSIKILKENALDQLKGRWGLSIGTLFMYYFILFGIFTLYSISNSINILYFNFRFPNELILFNMIVLFFLFGVLETGKCRFLLNLTSDYHSARFIDLFSQFKIYFKGLFLSLARILFYLLWFIPVILIICILISIYIVSQPIDMIFIPQYYFSESNSTTTIFIIISIYVILSIASIIINLMYS